VGSGIGVVIGKLNGRLSEDTEFLIVRMTDGKWNGNKGEYGWGSKDPGRLRSHHRKFHRDRWL
jgi:hypothetical protein